MAGHVSHAIEQATPVARQPGRSDTMGLPRMPGREPPTAPRRRLGRWLLLAALLVAGSASLSYWVWMPPAVFVVHPVRGPAVQAVYATGTVEATVMVPIAARTAARLVALEADEGTVVQKGQVLAQLEDDDLRRSIDEAIAEERYARSEFDRMTTLLARGVISHSAFDRAKADWEKAKAVADRAAVQADFLKLVAPADGRIIRRDGEIGQLIGANQAVFWMSCCGPLRIAAEVDEEDIAQVRPGQAVLIRADAFPGQIFNGTVQSVTPKGDPVARSYRVRIVLPEGSPLMIGMTAETNIILRRDENAWLLPAAAVADDSVWVVTDGHVVRRKVTLGAKTATEVEIRAGVAAQDWIVANAEVNLAAGDAVRPVPSAAAP
ncbi:MAG TPA: efflux RND transporter periplasmic adaptor subunit [Stellaceae bacterium]|nr:efflux RND transporter periplasmic adaptor subunit [Stellaceae bacterium]